MWCFIFSVVMQMYNMNSNTLASNFSCPARVTCFTWAKPRQDYRSKVDVIKRVFSNFLNPGVHSVQAHCRDTLVRGLNNRGRSLSVFFFFYHRIMIKIWILWSWSAICKIIIYWCATEKSSYRCNTYQWN